MATKKTQMSIALLAVAAVVIWGFVYVSMQATMTGPGATQTNASGTTTLTAGDDGLSLQKDLNALQNDPTVDDQNQLYTIQ